MGPRRGTAIVFFSKASCCWIQAAAFASRLRHTPSISFTAGPCAKAGTSSSLILSADSGENSPPQPRRGRGGAGQQNYSVTQHHPGASRHPSSAEEGSSPQVFADIHIPNQAVQIIWMEVEQFGRLGEIAAGLLDGFDNQLPLHAVDCVVVTKHVRAGRFLPFHQVLRQVLRTNVIG